MSKLIVGKKLQAVDKKGILNEVIEGLDLESLMEREIGQISGGELQRFAIGITCLQEAKVFMFDEPTSYLDIKQRLKAAKMIRSLLKPDVYVIAVDHDLTIIDYLSDIVCVLYGEPGAYGVVTLPYSVKEGINIYLSGKIPTGNITFRDNVVTINAAENIQ
jgi:ATP-binding cassette subfamily E protein 1